MVRFIKISDKAGPQKENTPKIVEKETIREFINKEDPVATPKDFIADDESIQKIENKNSSWGLFLENVKKAKMILYMALQGCGMEEDGSTIKLLVCNPFYFDRISERGNSEILNKIAQETFGSDKKISIVKSDKKTETKQDLINEALSVFGGEIIE